MLPDGLVVERADPRAGVRPAEANRRGGRFVI